MNFRSVFRTLWNIYVGDSLRKEFFCSYIQKKFYHKCLTGSTICFCDSYFAFYVFLKYMKVFDTLTNISVKLQRKWSFLSKRDCLVNPNQWYHKISFIQTNSKETADLFKLEEKLNTIFCHCYPLIYFMSLEAKPVLHDNKWRP